MGGTARKARVCAEVTGGVEASRGGEEAGGGTGATPACWARRARDARWGGLGSGVRWAVPSAQFRPFSIFAFIQSFSPTKTFNVLAFYYSQKYYWS